MSMDSHRVALVGLGTIGRGWAVLFAKAGFEVATYDPDPATFAEARAAIGTTLADMNSFGLIADPVEALARIQPAANTAAAVDGAFFVQESAPERIALKQATLRELDRLIAPDAILSSSCSSLAPDDIFEGVERPGRCIVAHPFNPPHLVPLVELLPSSSTTPAALEATRALMLRLGQTPVVIRKAVPGYVANRLQAAIVNEAMHLVGEGVISAADLDLCMTEALGRRWAFLGPFETMDLNADDGIAGYARNFRHAYEAMGSDLNVAGPWTDDALAQVVAARRSDAPLDLLKARREWRDRLLMKMLAEPPRAGLPQA